MTKEVIVIVPDSDYCYINSKVKYKSTIGSKTEEGWKVKITYNSDGSIDEKSTYTEPYIKEVLHPENSARSGAKPTNKGGKGTAKVRDEKKNDDDGDDDDPDGVLEKALSIIGNILFWPFKAIWWVIKQILKLIWAIVKFILSIIGLGVIVGPFSCDDND